MEFTDGSCVGTTSDNCAPNDFSVEVVVIKSEPCSKPDSNLSMSPDQNHASSTALFSTGTTDQENNDVMVKLETPLILSSNTKLTATLDENSEPTFYQDETCTPITQSVFFRIQGGGELTCTEVDASLETKPDVLKLESHRSIVVYSSSEEDDGSSSSDSERVTSISSSSSESDDGSSAKSKRPTWKSKQELKIEDLDYDIPAFEDLKISLASNEIEHVGNISSIIDCLVLVQSLRGMPVLNFDTVLFLEDGESLGKIFDVLGPVVLPLYAIRVAKTDVADKKLVPQKRIFYAPRKRDITNLVFTEELKQLKGSDASWQGDREPPESHVDYSDDEEETEHKKNGSAKYKKKPHGQDSTESKQKESDEQPQTKLCRQADGNRPTAGYGRRQNYYAGQRNGGPEARRRPRVPENVFRQTSTNNATYRPSMTTYVSQFPPPFAPPSPINQGWPSYPPSGRGAQPSTSGCLLPGAFSLPPPIFHFPPVGAPGPQGPFSFSFSSPPPPLPPNGQPWTNNGHNSTSFNMFFGSRPPPPPPAF